MRLFLILYFSREIVAQRLTPEQREAQRLYNAEQRKKNRQKNKQRTTKISTTTTTTPIFTTTDVPTSTTGFTTTLSTSTSWTEGIWASTTTTDVITTKPRLPVTVSRPIKNPNLERVIDRSATTCLSCVGREILECLQNGRSQECPKDSFCSLTMRTQNEEPIQYEMSCKQSAACLTNKKSNGWGVKGACSFTGKSSATCRQCCVGPDCIEYYRKFSNPDTYRTKWQWNAPTLEKPFTTLF